MPTVPTSFVPQVGMSEGAGQVPFQAPSVQPMENLAARQQQEIGARTTEVGNVAFRAGVILQDQMDDARTREEDTNFLSALNDITRGQNGYLRTVGKQADDNYAGTMDAIAKAAQTSMDRLQNDTQKRMFAPVLARNMMNAQTQITDHRDREVKTYYINENKTRAGQYIQQAINQMDYREQVDENGNATGPFNVNLGIALADIRNAGRAMGYADDSAQMHELERAVHTQVTQGVVGRLMSDNNYQDALDYVNKQNEKGNLQTDAAEKMMASVWSGRQRQMIEELSVQIKNTGIAETPAGFGNYEFPVTANAKISYAKGPGGGRAINIQTDPGAIVQSPQNAKVTDIKESDGTYAIRLSAKDGTEMVLYNLSGQGLPEIGAEVTRGQTIGLVGSNGTIRYAARKDGQGYVDPQNLNAYGDPDRTAVERPKTLREALSAAEAIPDMEMRRNVQGRLRTMYAQDEALDRQEYNDRLDKVEQFLVVPGNSVFMVPDDDWIALKPKDQQRLLGAERQENELDAMELLIRNPELLTKEWLQANRESFTRQTYLKLLEDVYKPDRIYEAKVNQDQLDVVLLDNKMDSLVYPTTNDDKARSLRLRESVREEIDRAQRFKGKPLSDDERKTLIQSVLADKVVTKQGWIWGYNEEITALLPADQRTPDKMLRAKIVDPTTNTVVDLVPADIQNAIRVKLLEEYRITKPTPEQIYTVWQQLGSPRTLRKR